MNGTNEVMSVRSMSCHARSAAAVLVIDGDPSARPSLESLLDGTGWQLRFFSSAKEFLATPRIMAPGCLVLDVSLPDVNGLELQKLLIDRPELPLVFLTSVEDVSLTVAAMKAGAVEFLIKPCSDDVLLKAIEHAVHRSERTLAQELEKRALRARYGCLSTRERQVMALVLAGLLNKQIGAELGISEITVKAHRGSLMRKMLARSAAELVSIALRMDFDPEINRLTRVKERNSWFPRVQLHPQRGAAFTDWGAAGGIA